MTISTVTFQHQDYTVTAGRTENGDVWLSEQTIIDMFGDTVPPYGITQQDAAGQLYYPLSTVALIIDLLIIKGQMEATPRMINGLLSALYVATHDASTQKALTA